MKTLVIEVPNDIERELEERAAQHHLPVEKLIVQYVQQALKAQQDDQFKQSPQFDPLAPLLGTLESSIRDVSEQHDKYIGTGLAQELKRAE